MILREEKKYLIYTLIFLLLSCTISYAQELRSFSELDITSKEYPFRKWNLSGTVSWKQNHFSQTWGNVGAALNAYRPLFGNFTLRAGLNNKYTYDVNISNNVEVRPWLGVRLVNTIIKPLTFRQEVRFEWRSFFFGKKEQNPDTYVRTRYRLWMVMRLFEKPDTQKRWQVDAGYEWYFLKNPSSGERYPNSREFTAHVFRYFHDGSYLKFGYSFENFLKISGNNQPPGNNIILGYGF